MPVESLKPLGALSVAVTWLVIGILLVKWPAGKHNSISRHAAQTRHTYWYMAIMQTFIFPAFAIFSLWWLAPTFHLSLFFKINVFLSTLGFWIAAWIPDKPGVKRTIHEITAYSAATLLIPILIEFSLNSNIGTIARIFSLPLALFMIYCIALFVFVPKAKDSHLLYQIPYIYGFHVAILLTTYVR